MTEKKTEIFNAARELFFAKGFKDTNISDITKMAGVAVGTFYNYYPSKEKLFLEVFIKESEKHKKRVMESLDLNDDPLTVAKSLVAHNINAMNSNRILREWVNRDFFSELEQYYRNEDIKNSDFIHNLYIDILRKWKAEGKIRNDINDDLMLAIFNALEHIDTHKEEIGIQHFPQIMEYLVEFIMKGLTDCRK